MNHLLGRGIEPLSIICRVGENHRQIERSCYIRGSKYPRSAIDSEMNGRQIGISPRGHRVVKLDDHSRVEKSTRCHEWLQGVALH